jgi:hypothetical protein
VAKKFTETTYQESIERVDAEQGILYGVKVLGENSRNKRKYVAKGMKDAAGKYEGVKSYVDHPERERIAEDRKFSAWSGVFRNPRYVEGKGIFADLHLRQKGEHFEGIIEAAQKFPTAVGFSHVAEGESHLDGETEIVESIKEVFSVDLVTDPATTAGFFESKQPHALREAAALLPEDHPVRKQLLEMMDAGYMDGGFNLGGDKEPAATDPVSQLTSILRDTIAALADSLKALAKASKPDPVLAAPGAEKLPGEKPPGGETAPEDSEEEDEEMSPEDKEKIAAFESTKRENAELKAKTLLLESGREASDIRVKALANCADDKEQRDLLESWPKLEQAGRPARSPAVMESANDFPRDNTKKFAASLR